MKVLIHALSQVSSKFLTKLLGFFAFTLMVKYLGTEGYGRYSYVLAFVSFFAMFADMGLNANLFKDASKRPGQAPKQLGQSLLLEGLLLPLLVTVVAFAALFMEQDHKLWVFIVLAAVGTYSRTLSQAFIQVFNGREHFHLTAVIDFIESAINLALVALVVWQNWHISGLLLMLAIKHALVLIVNMVMYFWKRYRLTWSFDLREIRHLMWMAMPFVVIGALNNVYQQVDIIMLKHMTNFEEVGSYGSAYRLLTFVFLIGSTLAGVAFPQLAQRSNQMDTRFFRFFNLSGRMLTYASVLITVNCVAGGQGIMRLLFGSSFNYAGVIFVVLSLSVTINFFALIPTYTLVAIEALWQYALVYVFSVAGNVFFNWLAIPRWQAIGASAATIFTEFITIIIVYVYVRRRLHVPAMFSLSRGLGFGLVTVISVGAAFYWRRLDLWWAIPGASLTFLTLFFAFRILNAEDWEWLLRMRGQFKFSGRG